LEAFRNGLERHVWRILLVALRSGYSVGLVVLRTIGGVARIRFGIEI
jgi:hypothetical protein